MIKFRESRRNEEETGGSRELEGEKKENWSPKIIIIVFQIFSFRS